MAHTRAGVRNVLKSNPQRSKWNKPGSKRFIAWFACVASSRPPEPVWGLWEDVIAPSSEIGRAPFTGDWHTWCYLSPWIQHPDRSIYTSNDWAMRVHMCELTAEPDGWDTSYEDETDISELGCMSFTL